MAKLTEKKALEKALLRMVDSVKSGPLGEDFQVPLTYTGEPSLDQAIKDALDWLKAHRVDKPLAPLQAFCFAQHRKDDDKRCFPAEDKWAFEIVVLRVVQLNSAAFWRQTYIEDMDNVQGTPAFMMTAGLKGKPREEKIRYCETILKSAGLM